MFFQERQFYQNGLLSFWKGIYTLKGKEQILWVDPFQKGLNLQESKQEVLQTSSRLSK